MNENKDEQLKDELLCAALNYILESVGKSSPSESKSSNGDPNSESSSTTSFADKSRINKVDAARTFLKVMAGDEKNSLYDSTWIVKNDAKATLFLLESLVANQNKNVGKPVAAQRRSRVINKSHPYYREDGGFSEWVECLLSHVPSDGKMYTIDSTGVETEYRYLYTAPKVSPSIRDIIEYQPHFRGTATFEPSLCDLIVKYYEDNDVKDWWKIAQAYVQQLQRKFEEKDES